MTQKIPLGDLLVDPNNYRFQDADNFVAANTSRFHEESVQRRAMERLRQGGLAELKNSILTNGFLPFERIIVRPYDEIDGRSRYLVIEGNRRVAALNWIRQDHEAGVDVRADVLTILDTVPVTVVLPGESGHDETLILSLMGVRHVGGIKEWGGYQRAKLVTELRDQHHLETAEIAARLGMTAHEVNRRYRAFRALLQMMQDEEFTDQAQPDMYPLFHEAVTGTVIKDWLGWNDEELRFDETDNRQAFYRLIVSTQDDEGNTVPPKLVNREAVRELREILPITEARRVLLDTDRSFADALALAKAENLSRTWVAQVGEAIAALVSIGALELQSLGAEDLGEITRLRDLADRLLELHSRLQA